MGSSPIPGLEKLIGTPRDGALLRYSLGLEYSRLSRWEKAIEHFRSALAADPGYSAAWRALGKALEAEGRTGEALEAYRSGVAAAEKKGDRQAQKEMTVFARRIERKSAP
jgi:tetratricopeptide (TPR) repeat protein